MLTLQVSGIGCGSCVAKITQALQALDVVATVAVDISAGQVQVESNQPEAAIRAAIEALGFEVAA